MRKEFVIIAETGVHARPATHIVAKANQFKSDITLKHEDKVIDLKSIMGLLSLGIGRGSLIEIETKGNDEVEAMEAISRVIAEFNIR